MSIETAMCELRELAFEPAFSLHCHHVVKEFCDKHDIATDDLLVPDNYPSDFKASVEITTPQKQPCYWNLVDQIWHEINGIEPTYLPILGHLSVSAKIIDGIVYVEVYLQHPYPNTDKEISK